MEKPTSVWFTENEKEQMAADPLLKSISQGVVAIYPASESTYSGSDLRVDNVRQNLKRLGLGHEVDSLEMTTFFPRIYSGRLILADYTAVRWFVCNQNEFYLSDALEGDGRLRLYRQR